MEMLKRLWNDEEGQGLIEYGLIIALVSLAIIVAGPNIYAALVSIFGKIEAALTGADTASTPAE